MIEKIFPVGPKRYIHVNRHAIAWNLKHKTNYPTIIVIDENKKAHELHSCLFTGFLGPGSVPGIEAKTFVVTDHEIIGYMDMSAPPTFALTMRKRNWKRKAKDSFRKFTSLFRRNS
jgi:hypothetical protein